MGTASCRWLSLRCPILSGLLASAGLSDSRTCLAGGRFTHAAVNLCHEARIAARFAVQQGGPLALLRQQGCHHLFQAAHVGLLNASKLRRAGALDSFPGAGCESPVGLISVLPGAFRNRCMLIVVKSLLWRNRSLQHFFPRLPKQGNSGLFADCWLQLFCTRCGTRMASFCGKG